MTALMAPTSSPLLNHVHFKGWPPQTSKPVTSNFSERSRFPTKRHTKLVRRVAGRTLCFLKFGASPDIEFLKVDMNSLQRVSDIRSVAEDLKIEISEPSHAVLNFTGRMVLLGDLEPATAKLAIAILGPFLSAFSFLFILRIVMSWYPKLPVGKLGCTSLCSYRASSHCNSKADSTPRWSGCNTCGLVWTD